MQYIQFDLQESSHVCFYLYYIAEGYVEPSQATKTELSVLNYFLQNAPF